MRRMVCSLLALVVVLGALAPVGAQGDALIGPDSFPAGINPLTGLPVDDPAVLDRRPVMVKVVNAPAEARPQWGLPQADIVWEVLLAGGVTRFAVVFLSQSPERVGPVRSLRLVDFELARMYRALVATSGMSVGTGEVLKDDGLMYYRTIASSGHCPALCRDETLDRPLEYTLFANLPALREYAEELGRDTEPEPITGLAFSADVPGGGQPVESLEVRYRNTHVNWTYDPAAGVWLRAHDGEPHLDATTGEQLVADNVIVVEEEHVIQPYVIEEYWGYANWAYSANFIGGGRAVLLRDGQYFEGEWRRESRSDGLYFVDGAGAVLPLKPGRTYFNLVPRWVNGYQLALHLSDPLQATVTIPSVYLRWGPSEEATMAAWAYADDTMPVIGRNRTGSWLQVVFDDKVLWIDAEVVDLDGDALSLPLARPTSEG